MDDVINPSGHRIGRLLFCFYWHCEVYICVCRASSTAVSSFSFVRNTFHNFTFSKPFFIQLNINHEIYKQTTTPGTAEIESALVSCAEFVSEAAVVGFPHEIKGEGIGCYVILRYNDVNFLKLLLSLLGVAVCCVCVVYMIYGWDVC